MTKEITLHKIESAEHFSDKLPLHAIDTINWQEFPYAPCVSFRIAYTPNEICIKFYVEEQHVKGSFLLDNETVCQDSCVECFVMPEGSEQYYNFEFNCLGTLLAAKRITRPDSTRLTPDELKRITRVSSIGRERIDTTHNAPHWDLFVTIPFDLIGCEEPPRMMRANLYKCGDKTIEPHFLSWSPIDTPTPNFHSPSTFGLLRLG
ncbi:MAG: carbohydrate-binding family 9-like protein [Rikenellaceae bacterium]